MRVALVLLLGSTFCFGQEVMTMQIVDKSAPTSPLQSVGTMTMSEKIDDGKAHDSKEFELIATNVSGKPIITFVEKLRIIYPSGLGETVIKEKDSFFGPKFLEPGQSVDLSHKAASGQLVGERKASWTREPMCEVSVAYVQFADGTTFGEEKEGMNILSIRQSIWNGLANLDYVYRTNGEKAFVEELQKPLPGNEVNAFFDMFRMSQKEKGTAPVIENIHRELQWAEERQAAMNRGRTAQ